MSKQNLVIIAPDRDTAVELHEYDPDMLIIGEPDGYGGTLIATDGRRAWLGDQFPNDFIAKCEKVGCSIMPFSKDWKELVNWKGVNE